MSDECPCYCQKIATTDIDLDTDLDMYKLSDKVKLFFRMKKRKALLVESVYNITVYIDNMMMNPDDLEFDGRVLKVPHKFGTDHIYRMVISYTPRRKMETSQHTSIQGYDPYATSYCIIPNTNMQRVDANAVIEKKYSGVDPSVSMDNIGESIISAKDVEKYIQKAAEIAKEEVKSERIMLEIKNYIYDDKNSTYKESAIIAMSESISSEFEKYKGNIPKAVLTLAKKFNVFLPDINSEASRILLLSDKSIDMDTLVESLVTYIQSNYTFDEDVALVLANEIAGKYAESEDISETADSTSDYYALGVNSYFVSTNSSAPKSPMMLMLDCIIVSNKENKHGNE